MKRKAFTLIELLVVISIIALLLSILMPGLQKAKEKAKEVVCKSQLKQWGPVLFMYTEDNNSKFGEGWNMEDGHQWPTTYLPYYETYELLRCPSSRKPLSEGNTSPTCSWGAGGHVAFDVKIPAEVVGSYGLNEWISNPTVDTIAWRNYKRNSWRSINKFTRPENVPLMTDSWWPGSLPLDSDQPPEYEGTAILSMAVSGDEMKKHTIKRHGDGIGGLFGDLSVQKVGLRRLWTLKWHRNFDTKVRTESRDDWPEWLEGLNNY